MDTPPFVTVIIPVWNGGDQISRCLTAIGALTSGLIVWLIRMLRRTG